jgi:hypothetical protein
VGKKRAPKNGPIMEHAKLVVIQTYSNRLGAELALSALTGAGIRAMIQADTAGGMREHLAWSGSGFRILVREEDATAAHDVLASPDTLTDQSEETDPDSDSRPTWRRFT